ncbi:Hsp20/alpha crystallin family protein [Neobacillus sp. D3-1R]|uniref:Hsp20/alpha crystallin family protein n=1 Tax=Neobacillus sp. D3-1R TaxID=3445778 RepID=UPI003FA12689
MSSNLPEKRSKREKEPFGDLMKSMNAFFNEKPVKGFLETIDEFFKNPFPNLGFPVEVVESNSEYIITAELPGVKKEQIHIDTIGNHLTITIKNMEEVSEEDDINQVYRRSHSIQRSSRTISLPTPIPEKKVKATYRDGLLQIKIPRNGGKSISIE